MIWCRIDWFQTNKSNLVNFFLQQTGFLSQFSLHPKFRLIYLMKSIAACSICLLLLSKKKVGWIQPWLQLGCNQAESFIRQIHKAFRFSKIRNFWKFFIPSNFYLRLQPKICCFPISFLVFKLKLLRKVLLENWNWKSL